MINDSKVQSVFTSKHFINLCACIIIWFSGALFIIKYYDSPAIKILFYSAIFCLVIIFIQQTEKYYKSFLTKNILFLNMLIVTAAAILLYRLEYIGYPSIMGFSILWLAIIYYSQNVKISLLQFAVFFLSPVLYSELISFSGLFSFSMLVLVSIFISERFIESSKLDWKLFLIAPLFGATVSANIIVSFIYIIYLLFLFRGNITNGSIFVIIMLAAYALLLFFADKGFVTIASQPTGTQIPTWVIICLVVLTLYVGWLVADVQEVLFTSGLILFTLFILSSLFRYSEFGWNKNELDFSLLIMAIPFLVLSIKEYKVDRFLGKVLN